MFLCLDCVFNTVRKPYVVILLKDNIHDQKEKVNQCCYFQVHFLSPTRLDLHYNSKDMQLPHMGHLICLIFIQKASEEPVLCVLMNKTRCLSILFNVKSPRTVTGTKRILTASGHLGVGLSAGGFVVLWSFPVWHVPGRVLLFTLRSSVYSSLYCLFSCATIHEESAPGERWVIITWRNTDGGCIIVKGGYFFSSLKENYFSFIFCFSLCWNNGKKSVRCIYCLPC